MQAAEQLTPEEQYYEEQQKLPWHERDYSLRKNPKVALIPPREGVVVGRGDRKVVIDPDEVFKLAKLHCTVQEIADYFGTSPSTISYNFSDVITKAKAVTKQRLRGAMLDTALSGNATLLIWLSKNMLGYSDHPQAETINNDSVEFEVKVITTDKSPDLSDTENEQNAETPPESVAKVA